MKTRETTNILLLAMLFFSLFSCSKDDDNGGGTQTDKGMTEKNILLFQSISEGAEIDANATSELALNYAVAVELSNKSNITLNGAAVSNAYIPDDKKQSVIIPLTLSPKTEYTLTIVSGTVLNKSNKFETAPTFTLHFKTKEGAQYTDTDFDALCNPNATTEAAKLYHFLITQYGNKTLSGVQSQHSNRLDKSEQVYKAFGKHPALAGFDFLFMAYSPTPKDWSWQIDYDDISAAQEQWKNNGVVSYMWHWNVPSSETDYKNADPDKLGFYCPGSNNGSGETTFDIREALKEGTWQHECILKDIDKIAGYLKKLQQAGIPILWRPLHEAAGNYTRWNPQGGAWFWWGRYGAEYCKKLWILLYDRLVNEHKLNNLIWIWTTNVMTDFENAAKEWYPGDQYVDIIGTDIYTEDNLVAQKTDYNFCNKLGNGRKMVTISECGNIPEPNAQYKDKLNWSWFMVWPADDTLNGYKKNTDDYWKQVLSNPYILNREDMPSLK